MAKPFCRPVLGGSDAGEVLKVGHSARTREAAGSIPAAGPYCSPAAKTGGSFTYSNVEALTGRPPVAVFSGETPMVLKL